MYPEGIRHIRADKRVNEWRSPGKRTIRKCALSERQVVIALSGGDIVYFEMDQVRETCSESRTVCSTCVRKDTGSLFALV